MPKVDLTITISVILGAAAILSPIATAIINNRFQMKLRRLDMLEARYKENVLYIKQVFERYLKCAGKYVNMPSPENLSEFGDAYFTAYLYAPENIRKMMSEINEYSYDNFDHDKATKSLELLATAIQDLLKKP